MKNLYLVRKVIPFYVVEELTKSLNEKQFETLSNITLLLDNKLISLKLDNKLIAFFPIDSGTRLFAYLEKGLKLIGESDKQKILIERLEELRKVFYNEKD